MPPEEADAELMHEIEGARRLTNRPQHRVAQVLGVASFRFAPGDRRRLLVQQYADGPDAAAIMASLHRELRVGGLIRNGDEWQVPMLYAWDLVSTVDGFSNCRCGTCSDAHLSLHPGSGAPRPSPHNIVHSDLKPDNVHIVAGRAMVFDLGGWTPVGTPAGMFTHRYSAPEARQLESPAGLNAGLLPHVDERSDLYAVGRMVEEMVLNRPTVQFRDGYHSHPRGRLANDETKAREYRDFVRSLQEADMNHRPWPIELLSDPRTRLSHPFFRGLDIDLATRIGKALTAHTT